MKKTKTRDWNAIAAWARNSAGPMGKRGKGRPKKGNESRQDVKRNLKQGGD